MRLNFKFLFVALASFGLASCTGCTKASDEEPGKKPGNEESAFASDDEFLDWLQRTHFNYMWEGAEPTSGLAPERIHMEMCTPTTTNR